MVDFDEPGQGKFVHGVYILHLNYAEKQDGRVLSNGSVAVAGLKWEK